MSQWCHPKEGQAVNFKLSFITKHLFFKYTAPHEKCVFLLLAAV